MEASNCGCVMIALDEHWENKQPGNKGLSVSCRQIMNGPPDSKISGKTRKDQAGFAYSVSGEHCIGWCRRAVLLSLIVLNLRTPIITFRLE